MTTSALATAALEAGVHLSQRLPGPTYESPTEGSPGFAGFVATFALALAIIALGISFTRRIRRSDHRERQRAAASVEGGVGDGTAVGPPVGTETRADVDPATGGGADGPPSDGERA